MADQSHPLGPNLGDTISRLVAEKLDEQFVEKAVTARIEKLVDEAVSDALRSYSHTGKLIKDSVSEALKVDRLDIPSYGSVVAAILKAQIEAKVSPLVAGQLAKDMDELLGLAPKEVKLSEIAEEMINARHGCRDYGQVITVIVEHSDYGYAHLYLDEEEVFQFRDKYSCRHRLDIDKNGKIYGATIAKRDRKDTSAIGRFYGVDQLLRAYVACGTTIIIDEDEVITSAGND